MTEPNPLVSVIIPCYNAERWVSEAINSCLQQTYQPLEIIVIDDQSTDGSLDVLRSFGTKIRLESTPHRGGCYARNRGVSLSAGAYIQFLDADDYLLPGKIERQVSFLEETGADVVYGDWRHQHHKPDGRITSGKVQAPGPRDDVVESLLGGWSTTNMSLLMRREVVLRCGGWDESLESGQDLDFFFSITRLGADVRYQPGCYSIYRRYGNVTVSTRNQRRWLDNQWWLFTKAERKLEEAGRLSARYRQALAQSYFSIARAYYDFDRPKYRRMLKEALATSPDFQPGGTSLYRWAQPVLGFELTDRMASHKRKLWKTLMSKLPGGFNRVFGAATK